MNSLKPRVESREDEKPALTASASGPITLSRDWSPVTRHSSLI
jgi:hypothetical protein